jgi:hypothetical protein
MTFGSCDDAPFFRHIGVIGSFLRRHIVFLAHQFVACLCPIGLGKLIGIALIDHGDFSCAPFHLLR